MNIPDQSDRAFNKKFDGATTEELVQELLQRKQAWVDRLSNVASLFDVDASSTKGATLAKNGSSAVRAGVTKAAPTAKAKPATDLLAKSLTDLVLYLLEREKRALSTSELTKLLLDLGWHSKSPDKAKMVSMGVSTLVKKKLLKRRGDRVALAGSSAAKAEPAAKRAAKVPAAKSAPKSKGGGNKGARATKGDGKTTAQYLLAGLAELEKPAKPAQLLEVVQRAGWTSTSSRPAKVLETALRNLAAKKEVKALGENRFQLAKG